MFGNAEIQDFCEQLLILGHVTHDFKEIPPMPDRFWTKTVRTYIYIYIYLYNYIYIKESYTTSYKINASCSALQHTVGSDIVVIMFPLNH